MDMSTNSRRARGHCDVLGSIPSFYQNAVLEQCTRRMRARGSNVWCQGDPAGYVAFLVSGTTVSSYQSPNGKTGTVGFWSPGDLMGAGDIGSETRHMSVRCLEDCVFHTLSFERFDDLVRRFPEISRAIIMAMASRLRWISHLAVMLETQSAAGRICAVLLALMERFGNDTPRGTLIDLMLTNEDLAAIAGVSRQHTNSTLQSLRSRGVLAATGRNVVVLDRAALAAVAWRHK